ncbi:MAG: hypothetical protein NWE77_04350 [Candidatus Bathyarchaeota archaeon]|jgi:hypothetical protein|nr:hypothetical protein [Candidatus Bathyarchaeota archaeon]
MKVGDKIRQVSPNGYPTRLNPIEAVVLEIKEDGIIVEFYDFYYKEVIQQFWPNAWKVELMEKT